MTEAHECATGQWGWWRCGRCNSQCVCGHSRETHIRTGWADVTGCEMPTCGCTTYASTRQAVNRG